MDKLKTVKLDVNGKTRKLVFKKINDPEGGKETCSSVCSYYKTCRFMKDPRNLNDPLGSFTDFCGDAVDEKGEDLDTWIPVPGTIEENLGDVNDVFQNIIEKSPCVTINRVIEVSCKDFCDKYTEDHKNCNCNNSLCIIKKLFIEE